MANAKFGRVITAMITPFTADGEVDYEGAVTLAKHLVEHGSEGILVGGTTGEGATMTADEKLGQENRKQLFWQISVMRFALL